MKPKVRGHLEVLLERYPLLSPLRQELECAFSVMAESFAAGGKLLVGGNGGSCADAEHIVGELMKGFVLPRKPTPEESAALCGADPKRGERLSKVLQRGLPTVALHTHAGLQTAYGNDLDWTDAFAQQLFVLGKKGDVFLGISTSGNAENVLSAATVAKAFGMKVIALSGKTGGALSAMADVKLVVPSDETYQIQELHLPIYHALCLMLEEHFFGV